MLCKYLYILLFKQTKKSPKLSNYKKKLFSWFQAAKNSTILQTNKKPSKNSGQQQHNQRNHLHTHIYLYILLAHEFILKNYHHDKVR